MDRYVSTEYGYCYYDMDTYEYPLIYTLFIHPEHRRKGKAKQLLSLVMLAIRNSGGNSSILIEAVPFDSCDVSQSKLESMYLSLGLTLFKSKDIKETK